jgi:hypothetical protein
MYVARTLYTIYLTLHNITWQLQYPLRYTHAVTRHRARWLHAVRRNVWHTQLRVTTHTARSSGYVARAYYICNYILYDIYKWACRAAPRHARYIVCWLYKIEWHVAMQAHDKMIVDDTYLCDRIFCQIFFIWGGIGFCINASFFDYYNICIISCLAM